MFFFSFRSICCSAKGTAGSPGTAVDVRRTLASISGRCDNYMGIIVIIIMVMESPIIIVNQVC